MREIHHVDRVMVVVAHPDDAEVRAGGTIARWTAAGKTVTYVIVTSGSRGGDGSIPEAALAATREAEQRAAAAILGVREIVFLGQEDGYLTPSLDLRRLITGEIRRYRPEVVITHNPIRHYGMGNHPDHFAVGEATYAAMYPTAGNPMAYPDLRDEGLEPWSVTWSMAIDPEVADHFEDIGSTLETKIAAIAAHTSQFPASYLGTARWIVGQMALKAAERGYPGMTSAEAFRLRFEGHPWEAASIGRGVPG